MPDITGITRDGYGSPVRATAPGKITDAIHDLAHQVEQALKADGVDWGDLHTMLDHLTETVTDVVAGTVNRHVGAWEAWQDQQASHRNVFRTTPGGGV